MLKEGIVIGGRYEVLSHIGAGGMADVYKAKDHKLNRLVAVKVLKAEFRSDTQFVAKFQREAQSAAGLSHPNIVNVFDVGEDRGLYYFVMELVVGITLKDYITKKGKLSVKEATSIAIQVSLGLEAAHNRGIVHRDVKPHNIIISTDGKVKLSDFGIAKAINSNTITANVMGSVHYSSPEQVRGGFSDAKSDIYSLGITMYEMVTGRVPFDGDTTVAIAIKHLQEEMVPPSRYTSDLPYSLEQIILKATQKNPENRYARIGELIEDLKRSLMDPQGNFVQLAPLIQTARIPKTPEAGKTIQRQSAEGPSAENRTPRRKKVQEPQEPVRSRRRPVDDDDDDDDAVSSRLEKAITIGGFLIGAVVIIILVVVIGNMAGLFNRNSGSEQQPSGTSASSTASASASSEEEKVSVPRLIGMTLDEAQAFARDMGLGVKQTGTQESADVPSGKIIYQDVDAGTKVAKNTTINVTISSGQSNVPIPTGLAGAAQSDAEKALTDAGLVPNAQLQYNDTIETGHVISTNPAEGADVLPGTTVTLYISMGPEPKEEIVAVPALVGYDEATAKQLLDEYQLTYTVVSGTSDQVPPGIVLSTDPAGGTDVPLGTSVTLTVNTYTPPEVTQEITPEPTPEVTPVITPVETTDPWWVSYSSLTQPENYTGGYLKLILTQGESWYVVYEGPNAFVDGVYPGPFYGNAGIPYGVMEVYEGEDGDRHLLATYDLTFVSPNA